MRDEKFDRQPETSINDPIRAAAWSSTMLTLVASAMWFSGCMESVQTDGLVRGNDAGFDTQRLTDGLVANDAISDRGNGDDVGAERVGSAGGTGGNSAADGSVTVDGIRRVGGGDGPGGPMGNASTGLWEAASAGRDLPTGAFPAGRDGTATVYVCRLPYDGGMQTGQASPLGECNFGWQGGELAASSHEVLIGAFYTWQPASGLLATVPAQAVVSGQETDGTTVYVCRAPYLGGIHPGKLSGGRCNIGIGGREVSPEGFDILLTMAPSLAFDPFDRTHWVATASPSATLMPTGSAFDGDLLTRWTSGHPQVGNEWFRVDLGAVATVSEVALTTVMYPRDFPVTYDLDLSTDDLDYKTVATGRGAAILQIQFVPAAARYVRIRQTGQNGATGSWWSIAELNIAGL